MTAPGVISEQRALVVSMVVAMGFAALGIGLGLVSGSQVILFEGFFSLLGVALAWMALTAAKVARSEPTATFPFGREGVAPLVIGLEGIALLATCGYAALEAVSTILSGGGDVVGGWGIVYAAVSFLVALGVAWGLGRGNRSELVAAEVTQWWASSAFGLGMLIAFIAGQLLERSDWSGAAPYIDPGLVLVAATVLVIPPIGMVRTTLRELLEGAPPGVIQEPVRRVVEQVRLDHGLDEPHLRMTKVGTKLYVEIDFLVEPDWPVRRSDDVRHAVAAGLASLGHEPWITVEFTADPAWGQ